MSTKPQRWVYLIHRADNPRPFNDDEITLIATSEPMTKHQCTLQGFNHLYELHDYTPPKELHDKAVTDFNWDCPAYLRGHRLSIRQHHG